MLGTRPNTSLKSEIKKIRDKQQPNKEANGQKLIVLH